MVGRGVTMVLYLLISLTAAEKCSGAPELQVRSAVKAPLAMDHGALDACNYLTLELGPALELNGENRVFVDEENELLDLQTDNAKSVFDLNKGGPAKLKELDLILKQAKSRAMTVTDLAASASAGSAKQLSVAQQSLRLPNGRDISISRLYANSYLIKVGPKDAARYEGFGQGLLGGTYCGLPVGELSRTLKRKLKPLVMYFLVDALSSGKLDDFASWVRYSAVFKAFFNIKEIEEFLEVYGYRSSEQGQTIPELSRMDPDKLWTFAWNAAAKLFHDKDFMDFSDLSSFQRDGKITFTLLGSQPIPRGHGNKFGFYTKAAGEVVVGSVLATTTRRWTWSQGKSNFAAKVELTPATADAKRAIRFPANARNGLLVLDVTLTRNDLSDLLGAYTSYFKALGFRFAARAAINNVPAFVEQKIADQTLDFLIRDGHSDGDDEDVMVLYPTGVLLKGTRIEDGRKDTIDIVFNLQKKATQRRIPYTAFSRSLNRRFAKGGKPLVYFDGSCWGIEKAWFGLGAALPSRLIEITSSSSVNFMENRKRNAMRLVLDGILQGENFDALRRRLSDLSGYANGREDHFVFPDEGRYPGAGALLKVKRRIFSRRAGKPFVRYTPPGYI